VAKPKHWEVNNDEELGEKREKGGGECVSSTELEKLVSPPNREGWKNKIALKKKKVEPSKEGRVRKKKEGQREEESRRKTFLRFVFASRQRRKDMGEGKLRLSWGFDGKRTVLNKKAVSRKKGVEIAKDFFYLTNWG